MIDGEMADVPVLPRPLPVPPLVLAMVGVMMGCMMDALIKHLGAVYTAVLIATMRYVFGTAFSGATVIALKRRLPDRKGLQQHALRAVASTGSAVLFFHCLTILPIAEATVLIFFAPLMIAPLARWILGEKIRPAAVMALLVGFIGMLITVQGAPEAVDNARRMEGIISGVSAACLYALSIVLLRQVAQRDDAIVTAFLGNVFPMLYPDRARHLPRRSSRVGRPAAVCRDRFHGLPAVVHADASLRAGAGAEPCGGRIHGADLERSARLFLLRRDAALASLGRGGSDRWRGDAIGLGQP